jgi:hypothetical protein
MGLQIRKPDLLKVFIFFFLYEGLIKLKYNSCETMVMHINWTKGMHFKRFKLNKSELSN